MIKLSSYFGCEHKDKLYEIECILVDYLYENRVPLFNEKSLEYEILNHIYHIICRGRQGIMK